MAVWKKVVVSGSAISQLNNDSNYLVQAQDSAILSGSFSGSFQGDGSGLTGVVATAGFNLTDGNGINDFTYNGSSAVSISVQASGSSLNVDANGVGIAAGGVLTSHIADNAVTADKLDDVFSDTPGQFGSSTAVPVITIDQQGRITSASTATISTTIAISGSTAGSDTVSLIDDALTFAGSGGITATVTNNTVTFGTLGSGFISASAEGDAQGQIKLNGVNVDVNALGSGDSPTFAALTTTGNLTVGGDLVVTGDTFQAQVTNLNVEDQFILLNSGSTTGDAGIIFGGADGSANTGVGLIWDFSYNSNDGRLAIVNSIAAGATGTQTPSYSIAGVFEGTEGDAATAQADHVGNIRVESGEIYIFV